MMKRGLAVVLAMAAPFAFSTPAHASSDSTCYPQWKVKQTAFWGCSGMALLSPGNDTRINLLMLLYDRHGDVGVSNATSYDMMERRGDAQPFDYGQFSTTLGKAPPEDDGTGNYAGDRCATNDAGRVEFEEALGSVKGLPAAERSTLAEARALLVPECSDGSDMRAIIAKAVESVSSAGGKAMADYLRGAAAFYDGDFASARALFQTLARGASGWSKEAASYMLGRVELNAAMENAFDEYGYPAEAPDNKAQLAAAEKALKAYNAAYPQGRYTVSAGGLLRKVYWLGKDYDRLLAEYVAAFKRKNMDGSNVSLANLVQEMDVKMGDKLDVAKVSDPQILAMLDLQAMRYSDDPDDQSDAKPITRATIEGQRTRFAGQEALYNYVLAAHAVYVAKDADAALKLLPASATGDSYLAFSQRALRAIALEMKGDAGARAALSAALQSGSKPFQRGSMELALAMYDERHSALDKVFAAGSLVQDAEIRERLLRYTAGPQLLRAQATGKGVAKQEREVALFALLYKQLLRGQYKAFLADQALVPAGVKPRTEDDYALPPYTNLAMFKWAGTKDGFACPSLATLATALSGAPKDAPSLLCLGEFVRINNLDPGATWPDLLGSLDMLPQKDELGGTPSLFPGKRFSRLDAYKAVIADPAAAPASKAYALYRAVYCWAPSGYNGCDATEAPQSQRKAWFNQLKQSYPTSAWAKKIKYYW